MRAQFVIDVDLDPDQVEREGKRAGLPLDRAIGAVLSDLENRLVDSIRFRDGVERVGSRLQDVTVRTLDDDTERSRSTVA